MILLFATPNGLFLWINLSVSVERFPNGFWIHGKATFHPKGSLGKKSSEESKRLKWRCELVR